MDAKGNALIRVSLNEYRFLNNQPEADRGDICICRCVKCGDAAGEANGNGANEVY